MSSVLPPLVRDRLSESEVINAVLLAAAALVVLPLLPDRAVERYGVVNPRVIWTLVFTGLQITLT